MRVKGNNQVNSGKGNQKCSERMLFRYRDKKIIHVSVDFYILWDAMPRRNSKHFENYAKKNAKKKKRTHGQLCLVLPRHNGPLSSPTLVTDSHRSNWGYVWDAGDHTALHNCRALPFSIITDVFFLLSLPSLLFPIDLRWVGRHHAGQQDGSMTWKNETSFIYGECMQRRVSESLLVIMMTTFLEIKLLISFI